MSEYASGYHLPFRLWIMQQQEYVHDPSRKMNRKGILAPLENKVNTQPIQTPK